MSGEAKCSKCGAQGFSVPGLAAHQQGDFKFDCTVFSGLVYNMGFEGLYILQDVVLKVIFEIKHTHKRNPGIPPIPPPPPSHPY